MPCCNDAAAAVLSLFFFPVTYCHPYFTQPYPFVSKIAPSWQRPNPQVRKNPLMGSGTKGRIIAAEAPLSRDVHQKRPNPCITYMKTRMMKEMLQWVRYGGLKCHSVSVSLQVGSVSHLSWHLHWNARSSFCLSELNIIYSLSIVFFPG